MTRRWMIRGILMGLIALCFAAWCWSSTHDTEIEYVRLHPPWCFSWYSANGILGFSGDTNVFWQDPIPNSDDGPEVVHPFPSDFEGWKLHSDYRAENQFWPYTGGGNEKTVVNFWGFYLGKPVTTSNAWEVGIPYWFLILVATGLLWLGWRKTRPKPQGFPLEPKQAGKRP